MPIYSVNTASGGSIELFYLNDRFKGQQLVLHVDQSTNVNTTDDECNIIINDNEVKDLISLLNGYLTSKTGIPYVVLAEHLANPAVKINIKEFIENTNFDKDKVQNSIIDGIINAIDNPNNNITPEDFIN